MRRRPAPLRALLLSGDDTDRALARGKLTDADLNTLARRRQPREATRAQAVRHAEIRRLAVALRDGRRAINDNRRQLQRIVGDLAPGLTDRKGIGPVSAAQAIVSFSHPGRCRDEAAYAALGGISPIEASSGRHTRHRLNRGGCHFSESTARIPGVLRTSFPDTGDGGSAGGTRSPTHVGV